MSMTRLVRLILSWALIATEAFALQAALRNSRTTRIRTCLPYSTSDQQGDAPFSYKAEHEFVDYTFADDNDTWYDDFVNSNAVQPPRLARARRQDGGQYDEYPTDDQGARSVAAGVGTGVLGMLVCGCSPIGAMVLGFSAAYAADQNQGVVGDSARAMGDVALSAQAKASEIDEKHHLVHKAGQAAGEAWQKAKELDREHKIVQKAKDVAVYGSTATVDFVQRHHLVERGLDGIGKGVSWLSDVVTSGSLSPEDEGLSSVESSSEMTAYKRSTRRS